MRLHDVEQGGREWHALRAGAFTASRIKDLMARTKSGPSTSRANLITTLAVERITGETEPTFFSDAMARGQLREDEARTLYAQTRGVRVQTVGICQMEDQFGFPLPVLASPDGLINDDGLVEIKCPSAAARHLDALRSGAHAHEHRWQVQHQMMVTGRLWCDVVSYDPRWPEHVQLAVTRVERDRDAIEALREEISRAEDEVAAIVADLMARAA